MARPWLGLSLLLTWMASLALGQPVNYADVVLTITSGAGGPCTGSGDGEPGHVVEHLHGDCILLATSNGLTTQIPLQSAEIHGFTNITDIFLSPKAGTAAELDFVDRDASLSDLGRTGEAILDTTLCENCDFYDSLGSLDYTLTCKEVCFNGDGTPTSMTFSFTFQASGVLNVPLNIAQLVLPTIVPLVPASVSVSNSYEDIILNLFGMKATGSFRSAQETHPAASGSSGGASGSLTLTPPWEPVQSTFSATAMCLNLPTGCWLTIPTASGVLPPFTNTPITVDLNLADLGAGVYPANVSLSVTPSGGTAGTTNMPFALVVGNGAPALQLSETGVPFQSVAGLAQSPPAHTVYLTSSGPAIPYTATASTLGGGNWLTVTPASGSVTSSMVGVSIAANPTSLAAGTYFGRADISAPSASKPVQSVEVTLTVASASGTAPILSTPILSTTGVIFVTPQGLNPAPQMVTVSLFSAAATTIKGQASADDLSTWLTGSDSSAAVQAGSPITETLSVNAKTLAPGVYNGTLYETVEGTGAESAATVLLVVTPAGTPCTPTQLLPVLTNLGATFEFPAGLPVSVQAQVVDDCGNPLTSGTVQATFNNGDATVEMTPLGGGMWAGTWEPHRLAGGTVSVGINAVSTSGLSGITFTAGTLDANPAAPVVNPGGIVNAAGPAFAALLAPGEFISIFGSNLGPTTPAVSSLPYVTSLGGTQVLLSGQPVPLQFVSSGQINALVPYGAVVNGFQDLLVEQNGTYSLLETLVGAAASPATFTLNQSGTGAGAIIVVEPNGTAFVAGTSRPASAGDVLEIYCAGLGPVRPPVADGAAAPLMQPFPETVTPVNVSIGGQNAQVLYAGLAPGFAGLYQVDAIVPAGITGANVPVILSTAGFSSATVTLAIQ